jgi:hypothetical protein
LLRGTRFLDEIVSAVSHRLHGHGNIAVSGDQDHREILIQPAQIGLPFKAALAAQAYVADHDERHVGTHGCVGGLNRSKPRNRKPRKFERLNTADPDVVVVLDVDHAD